jgi:hypothetical protein
MTQGSLVGSTVNTRSKKAGSVVGRISSPSVKSIKTNPSRASEASKSNETSKILEYYSPLDLYPTNLSHVLYQNQTLKDTDKKPRNSMKMMRVVQTF